MKKFGIVILLGLVQLPVMAGQGNPKGDTDTTKTAKQISLEDIQLEDDPYVAMLDSLLFFDFFVKDSSLISTEEFIDVEDSIYLSTDFPDSVYESRLAALDALTPLSLDYNERVKRFIGVYSRNRREQVSRMLGLANYYFPMFEEMLDKYNIPLELKYLAVVESALNPTARSRAGAVGLWQFMYSTGKLNGLSVSSYIDERSDPLKSTEAACKYLQTLYGIFDDWNLALAAYNSGPGNVNKAIRRSGGKRNYWEILPYLPRETRGYVPAFIAVNYIMNYAGEHYIYTSDLKPSYLQTDTVLVKEKLSFDQISSLVGVSEELIAFLNPGYRYKVIPKVEGDYCSLVLPSSKMGLFIANEDSIYRLAQQDFEKKKTSLPQYVEMNDRITHRVRRGEVLGTIAERYGVSVSSIRRWNGLRGNTIRIGQRLTIHPRKLAPQQEETVSAKKEEKPQTSTSASGKYVLYTVRSGETFYSIARKYPGISANNIMSWNNISNARRLKPGMRLKIYN